LARERARYGSVGAHRAVDQAERNVVDADVGERPELTKAVHLSRPVVFVVDIDQADIEIYKHVLARPLRIDLLEGLPRELLLGTHTDRDLGACDQRVDPLAGTTSHVST